MTSKLGAYWSVMHRRAEDYQYFSALQPSVIKLMDAGRPDYDWVKQNLPNALVVARNWARSEQHQDMLKDPVATGERHAREWDEQQRELGFDKAKTVILGVNEPTVWEPGFSEALRLYTIALCDEAGKSGMRVGAMQFGVGWPNNNGPDTPPDWSPWHGVEEAILRNNGVLVAHCYWADKGPSENWGWWAGRTLKCPWQVPIVIGECGVDMFVKDTSVGQQNRGWLGHMPPERYAAELVEYTNRMGADPRFVGCCVFASDFQAHEWYSFDVQPAYKAVIAALPTISDAKPVETHLPTVSTGQPAPTPSGDAWARSIAFVLKWEGGYQNDVRDLGNWTGGVMGVGTNKGTNFGISAASYPNLDIQNLTQDEAVAIYARDYWQPSGAAALPWPACLIVFDTAVLHGVGAAQKWLAETGPNALAFAAKRLSVYSHSDNWHAFGAGWMNRVADLLTEASK